jgi:muramoyltetrapeptide carboxypeptidase
MTSRSMTVSRSITLIAPSGYPADPLAAERGIGRLRHAGHTVGGVETTDRRHQRFAGSDAQRVADLNRLADPAMPLPDIVLAVRGGFGASRLLGEIDYAGLKRRLNGAPTALVGHSDFTAIQLALLAQSGLTTFGGPMLTSNFGAATLDQTTWDSFWRTLNSAQATLEVVAAQADAVQAEGVLWGGNLALLTAMIGTPYLPQVDGGLLFIEDVNEPPFRIERMILQLHQAGILARQQALILGDFTDYSQTPYDNGYTLETMIESLRHRLGVPIIRGLPFGHGATIVTVPVGATARLVSHTQGFSLSFSGYPNFA